MDEATLVIMGRNRRIMQLNSGLLLFTKAFLDSNSFLFLFLLFINDNGGIGESENQTGPFYFL